MPPRLHRLAARRAGHDLLLIGGHPALGPLLPAGASDHAARLLEQLGPLPRLVRALTGQRWLARAAEIVDRVATGGALCLLALRKRLVDDETRAAISAGATTVVVIGAGYDTLCWRLAKAHPEITFIETDGDTIIGPKRAALSALGAPPNVILHALDTPLDLGRALAQSPWRGEAPSVLIAETALTELAKAQAERLLHLVHDMCAPASTLLVGYRVRGSTGRAAPSRNRYLAALSGALSAEPSRWSLAEGQLTPWLAARGFACHPEPDRCDLKKRYLLPANLADLPLDPSERVAVAERER